MALPRQTATYKLAINIFAILLLSIFSGFSQNGYVKKYNGVPDWVEIAGKNLFGGTSDGGTLTLSKTSGNQEFKSYIFNKRGTSNSTLIGIRQDSSANSKGINVVVTGDTAAILRRTTKGGTTAILGKYKLPAKNIWIKVARNGTTFSASYATDSPTSSTQSYTNITSILGAYNGWANSYWRGLGVASNSPNLASTEFARYNGGAWIAKIDSSLITTTTQTPTNTNCDCGFNLLSVSQLSNTEGQFTFNSCSVSGLEWKLKNTANTVLGSGTVNTVTSSTVSFTIPANLATGYYIFEANASNCVGADAETFGYTVGTTTNSATAWVEYPNGQYIYDLNGNAITEQLRLSLSGANSNTLNVIAPGFGCPSDRTASYTIDEGFYTVAGNSVGWISGIPSSITLVPDGRVHTLTIGCVGDVWGEGSNKGITNVVQQYFKVGGTPSATMTPDANLSYVQYPSSFVPNVNSLLRQTTTQFPDFTLPNKHNATLYGFPKSLASFDFSNRGWRYWGYNSTIANTKRYWLDPDTWANGALNDSGIMDDATALEATSWGEQFANSQGGVVRGELVSDGEWRGLQMMSPKGLNNSYYFWKKAREIIGNDAFLGEHQQAPFIPDARWNRGELTLEQLSIPMNSGVSASTVHNLNNHPQAQLWNDVPQVSDSNIPNIPSGARAGDYMDIVVNGYTSAYNQANAYTTLWATWVNKKYWPSKRVQVVIEGFNETSVYGERFGQIIRSWKWGNKGAAIFELPPLSASANENIALIANTAGDGIQDWRSTGNQQETNPAYYHCNNSYRGCSNIANYDYNGETYPTTWNGVQDYITAGLYKFSQVPSDVNQSEKFFYEMSLDNKVTWITGINLNPLNSEKFNRPSVIGMKNSTGSKHAILAIFQKNNPTQQYSFHIRHPDFGEKRITVNGQFPELIIFNQ